MRKNKTILLTVATFAAVVTLSIAQDTPPKPAAPADTKPAADAKPAPAEKKAPEKQADVASKTAKFGKASRTDESYKTALDAHALEAALKAVDKDGAFKGTVTKIFEPRGGAMAIVNFDANYKTALTALLKKENFDKFPALTNLVKKEVVVTGKFIEFQGRAEIVLTNSTQVKVVE
jgi:hypothetical protein